MHSMHRVPTVRNPAQTMSSFNYRKEKFLATNLSELQCSRLCPLQLPPSQVLDVVHGEGTSSPESLLVRHGCIALGSIQVVVVVVTVVAIAGGCQQGVVGVGGMAVQFTSTVL